MKRDYFRLRRCACGRTWLTKGAQYETCSKQCEEGLEPKTCDGCEAEFIPTTPWKRYCSRACGKRARRRQRRAAQ